MSLRDNPEFCRRAAARNSIVADMYSRKPPRLTDAELARLDDVRFGLDEIECEVMGWAAEAHESAKLRRGERRR